MPELQIVLKRSFDNQEEGTGATRASAVVDKGGTRRQAPRELSVTGKNHKRDQKEMKERSQ